MTKTRRNLAVAVTLCAIGGSLLGATSAMAADRTDAHPAHSAAQAPEPTVEVTTVSPDESTSDTWIDTLPAPGSDDSDTWIDTLPAPGSDDSDTWIDTEPAPEDTEDAGGSTWIDTEGAPAYLELLKTDEDVDAAQLQIVDFMKARGLQVTLAHSDEDGRPYAEYDTFVEANGDAVDAYWAMRLAEAQAQG